MTNTSRRNFIKSSIILPLVSGCTNWPTVGDAMDTMDFLTGIAGYNNPKEIMTSYAVTNFKGKVKNQLGVNFNPSQEINPPNLEGRYNISGENYNLVNNVFQGPYILAPGKFNMWNQRPPGIIDMNYAQNLQIGSGLGNILVCGSSNEFAIYSLLNLEDDGSEGKAALVFRGFKESNENLNGDYVGIVLEGPFTSTYGTFNFSKTTNTSFKMGLENQFNDESSNFLNKI